MKIKLPNRRGMVRWLVILLVIVIVGLYIVLPVAFGIAVVFPYRESVGAAPDGFADVSLETSDGITLAGWYAPPSNGAVIIVLPGAGGTREDMRGYAAWLVAHDYGVLAFDPRGTGDSGGPVNRLGWQGTRDVGAAMAFLAARDEVEQIGGLGLSLGAEVLLGAASTYPALAAIVADGATQRSIAELRTLPTERPLYRNFTARVMFATVQVLSGDDPPQPTLLESMIQANTTTYLLIAGGQEDQEIAFNEYFTAAVDGRATLWIASDAPHTGAYHRYPDEYEQRVIAFLDAALLDN